MTATTVSTTDAVYAALKTAAPGDAITLAPGAYDTLNLGAFKFADPGVQIHGAGAKLQQLVGQGCEGVLLTGFEVFQTAAGWMSAVNISSAKRVVIDTFVVHGSTGRGGVSFRDSSGCGVTNTKVFDVGVGIVAQDSDGTHIAGNDVSAFTVDGMDIAGSPNTLIEDNDVHDAKMTVAGTHPDGIQFWQTPAHQKPAGNVVRGNRLWRGDGTIFQGIFSEDQTGMLIEDNALVGTMYNGIGISGHIGSLIQNNFVQGYPDMGTRIITRGGSSDVLVKDNVTQSVFQYIDKMTAVAATATSPAIPAQDIPNPNYQESGNKIIGEAPQGSLVDFNAWLSTQSGHQMPPPPPATDPVDPTIELKGEIQALQTQLDTAQKQAALAQSAADTAKAANDSLSGQLSTATSNVASLQTQLAAAQAQVSGLQTQLATAQSQASATLKTQLAAAQAQVTTLTSQLNAAKATLTSTSAALAKDEAKLAQIKKDLAA